MRANKDNDALPSLSFDFKHFNNKGVTSLERAF